MITQNILSIILVLPLLGAAAVFLLPRQAAGAIKATGIAFSLVAFILSVWLFIAFDAAAPGMQFIEYTPWIPSLDVSFHIGIDGISLLLVVLTTFLTPIALLASWDSVKDRLKGFVALMLLLEMGTLGVFLSLDLFLFYVFWEFMLIPMYFIIGIWGGAERVYAAVKFFLYTMAGSVLMLVAILSLWFLQKETTGVPTFDLQAFYQLPIAPSRQLWMFLAFAFAFAIKVPMFPLHTWLPDAHVEAPTAGSVILAAVLLKMGSYGFLRFAMPLFPNALAVCAPYIAWLSIIGIVYGALVAMVQPDLKKLVAYSSVSHMGFAMLGLMAMNSQGFAGSMMTMLNHGVSTGALFLLVGVVYERRHTRKIADFGGLWKVIPVYSVIFLVVMLSSVGLPGTNGFIGEFLVLLGAFKHQVTWAVVAATGVILSACYMLWMFQRVVFGPVTHEENRKLTDLSFRERLVFAPLLVLIFWMGAAPQPFLDRMQPALDRVLQTTNDRAQMMASAPAPAGTLAERVVLPARAEQGGAR